MGKKVKMILMAECGVGKSTFASCAPKPFFICTDGNYEWLDRPEEDHIEVSSWEQTKSIIKDILAGKYDKYETIVVDLVEDLFKWCEYEACRKARVDHVSDLGGYGKGYDITRNEFFIEMSKLISSDFHIILLTHAMDVAKKTKTGLEKFYHYPSTRVPDKVWDMLEGRVRYFLRAYINEEENEEGVLVKKRYLSLVPKSDEPMCITRGIDESITPHDIPLDWNTFASIIGVDSSSTVKSHPEVKADPTATLTKPITKATTTTTSTTTTEAPKPAKATIVKPVIKKVEPVQEVEETVEETPVEETTTEEVVETPKTTIVKPVIKKATPIKAAEPKVKQEVVNEEPKATTEVKPTVSTGENKLSELKAKLAAAKAKLTSNQ